MQRLICLFIACCMAATLMTAPVYAAEVEPEDNVTIITLSDDVVIEIRSGTYSHYSTNTKSAFKTATAKVGGREVGSATLYATFEYTGATARVTGTDYSYSTISGCTYSHGGITTSGNRATMTGTFYYGGSSYPFSISLTCSATGTVS